MTDSSARPGGADPCPPEAAPRVWLLDDSPLECEMARRALGASYRVETFGDGPALLDRIVSDGAPDLLLLDWQLPGMSGLQVCKFLRSTRDRATLPILMLTVHGHKADLVEALAAGANDYVTKPYDASELAARAATLLAMRRLMALAESERGRAERANRAKDEFLAMISHELRTPLSSILGWVRVLRGGNLPAHKHDRALEVIERSALAQSQLVEDLLDIGSIAAGKVRIELAPMDLVSSVEMAVETARPAADAKGVALDSVMGSRTAPVAGDPARIQQVVSNLILNALKFTAPGGRVHVGLTCQGGHALLRVEDTGRGISPEFLPHVFERFRQADGSASRAHGGVGLGLAIVRHLVEAHGGAVTAESAGEGRGATFTVRLPALLPGAPVGSIPAPPVEPVPGRLSGVSVLLVDDDRDLSEILSAILEGYGATVAVAAATEDALEVLRTTAPRVLVSDVCMPGADGLALIRSVRRLAPAQGGSIPAVALSGRARAQDRAAAMMAGYDLHLPKPVEPLELLAAITTVLGRARPA